MGKRENGEVRHAVRVEPHGVRAGDNDVAIVGLGCRFAGGIDSADTFWNLVIEGRNAVRELPQHRRAWQRAESNGGFLDGVDEFDAQFFGVSAAEARYMDPQQRLLLEVAWEAMENAGIDASCLAGRRVGVFVGSFTNDYELLQSRAAAQAVGPYFGTGTSAALLAGRLAYRFGMTGPALVVNTACSSSLVAMHLARRSLLLGESEFALVAGVNLILSDEISTSFRAAGMLAPDAQCKPWDAAANGYVRSEGAAAVLLEKVHDATLRGGRIWARIIGSAINQDGATGGITAPSATAQQNLIGDALHDAGISADAVQYIEAHGTGTPIGDPIEFDALTRVFSGSAGRSQPLVLGSIKGNLGHTEAAAGLAGVIKVLLAMRHAQVPATVNHHTLNPELRLQRIPAVIPTAPIPWPQSADGVAIAGVSSFGFSGTNAHVILAHHRDDLKAVAQQALPPHLLCLSAPTAGALTQVAGRYEDFLRAAAPETLAAVCHTAYVGRKHFRHRLAVSGGSLTELADAVAAYREGGGKRREGAHYHTDTVRGEAPRVAFLFTGQGAQYWGMGRELFETDDTFRQSLLECDEHLAPKLGCSLVELLIGTRDSSAELGLTRFTQPALFAFQLALSNMFQAWGIRPVAVLGHSVGEFAAAVTAGVMSLSDALTIVEARGSLMQALPGGGMTAVQASAADVAGLLAELADDRLCVAVVNGPNASVIAGEKVALEAAHKQLLARNIGFAELDVSHAFHTPMMRDVVEPFRTVLQQVKLNLPSMPFFSSVTGALAATELTGADYWCAQLVKPVLYLPAVQQLDASRFDACLEIGPSAILTQLAKRCELKGPAVWIGAQQRGQSSRVAAVDAGARLYTLGVALNHERIGAAASTQVVSLPTYPFQRKSYWIEFADGGKSHRQMQGDDMTQDAHRADATEVLKGDDKDGRQESRGHDDPDSPQQMREGAGEMPAESSFVRFEPFATPAPGFTWLPSVLAEELQAGTDAAYGEMHAVLFGGVEFRHVRRVLDLDCGRATDLIELAQMHGHLSLDGCSISAEQIDHGRRAIAQAGLYGRIQLHHLDSTKEDFPGLYDVIVSHQAIHPVHDKDIVLRNITEHLRKGAILIAAEVVSNRDAGIEHDASSAHLETRDNWAGLLAQNQLRVMRCVDASEVVANDLHDNDFAQPLRETAGGSHALGELLRRGEASYLLLLVQRDYLSTGEALLSENRQRFANPLPYAEARRALAVRPAKAAAAVGVPLFVRAAAQVPAHALAPKRAASVAAPVRGQQVTEEVAAKPPELAAALPTPAPLSASTSVSAPEPAAMPSPAPIVVKPADTVPVGVAKESLFDILGQLLECVPESLDPEQTLVAQGLNSIHAIELTRRMKSAFGVSVTVKALLSGETIASLARSVSSEIVVDGDMDIARAVAVNTAAASTPLSGGGHADLLNRIDAMGEAEINRLLTQLDTRHETSL